MILFICLSGYFLLKVILSTESKSKIPDTPNESMVIMPAFIDSLNDITHVSTLQSGIIQHIDIRVGKMVKKEQLLFALDDATAKRNVQIHQQLLIQAKNHLMIQENDLKHAKNQFSRLKSIDPRAISRESVREKAHEVNTRARHYQQAKQELAIAQSNLNNAKLTLSQFRTYAPKDGIILKINNHPNEFVGAGQQVIWLGDADKIMVRVSIDERDINIIKAQGDAYLTSKNYGDVNIPIQLIQLDRFIIYHDQLNARVQEALYFFKRKDYPNFVAGQQVDAHISTKNTTSF